MWWSVSITSLFQTLNLTSLHLLQSFSNALWWEIHVCWTQDGGQDSEGELQPSGLDSQKLQEIYLTVPVFFPFRRSSASISKTFPGSWTVSAAVNVVCGGNCRWAKSTGVEGQHSCQDLWRCQCWWLMPAVHLRWLCCVSCADSGSGYSSENPLLREGDSESSRTQPL